MSGASAAEGKGRQALGTWRRWRGAGDDKWEGTCHILFSQAMVYDGHPVPDFRSSESD